jgi:hypothetical protein
MVQSRRFFSDPGNAPACSGVEMRIASGRVDLGPELRDGFGKQDLEVRIEMRKVGHPLVERAHDVRGRIAVNGTERGCVRRPGARVPGYEEDLPRSPVVLLRGHEW